MSVVISGGDGSFSLCGFRAEDSRGQRPGTGNVSQDQYWSTVLVHSPGPEYSTVLTDLQQFGQRTRTEETEAASQLQNEEEEFLSHHLIITNESEGRFFCI